MPDLPTIPDEAVEIATKAAAEAAGHNWFALSEHAGFGKDVWRRGTRAALAAAVPLCLAAALEDLADGLCCGHVLWDRAEQLRSSVAAQTPKET